MFTFKTLGLVAAVALPTSFATVVAFAPFAAAVAPFVVAPFVVVVVEAAWEPAKLGQIGMIVPNFGQFGTHGHVWEHFAVFPYGREAEVSYLEMAFCFCISTNKNEFQLQSKIFQSCVKSLSYGASLVQSVKG